MDNNNDILQDVTTDNIHNCTFCKTILMIPIMLYHSFVFWTGTWWDSKPILSAPIIGMIAVWLNSYHVYAFALISGYIFSFIIMRGDSRFVGFIENKEKHLLIPYVLQ